MIDFQIAHISRASLITDDNKVYELRFTRLNKKEQNMRVLDFIVIRGQQVFEDGREINPTEIKIDSNQIQNISEKFKNSKI